ncbi:hypothetical protein BOTBODRAFT_28908 [Botryobasidium botryosum FD-172 SS1]|uniref:GID complex catalytic subunit 2 n=1 Tax=Botryobasidium botryosum (strain FD-172 SS1) TaxID=930990 RepID=A0A067MSE3_BOTB1|nr:hypothetical protein BOTBODRAFT_28908 [Botryobasidium botryosum FD-172 SS1]
MAQTSKEADPLLKELDKLERLSSFTSSAIRSTTKTKSPSISDSLDSLIASLKDAKQAAETGQAPEEYVGGLSSAVDDRKREVEERQKEIHSSLARFGRALDKKFPNPLPSYSPLFTSPKAAAALEHTIVSHFIRTGSFSVAETFLKESEMEAPDELRRQFVDMHRILTALRSQDIGPALEWAIAHRDALRSRMSPLEFHIHRSQYLRLLLSQPTPHLVLRYARRNFPALYAAHASEIQRLLGAVAFIPRLASLYPDFASPNIHTDVEAMFARDYCAMVGMSREVPLRVVGDIGGGGALARIEKGNKVMRDRKSEWSQTDELPIEIPLPPRNRYHSVFACPVSKEQSTEDNPPVMLQCGHVLAKDSWRKLEKGAGRVKCPYCPVESTSPPHRVFF